MENEQNDVDLLNGWVVALVAGKTFLGRRMGAPTLSDSTEVERSSLDPCYELNVEQLQIPTQVRGPDGQPAMTIRLQAQRTIGAIANFDSWRSLELPPGAVIKPTSEFSEQDQKTLAGLIKQLEDYYEQAAKAAKAEELTKAASAVKAFGGGPRSES